MSEKTLQIISIVLIVGLSGLVLWIYAQQPQSLQEVVSKASVTVGTYAIDEAEYKRGVELFRADNFSGARDSFARADPEKRDAKAQFYTAYSFYRQGFGKVYDDDTLFKQGIASVDRVITIDPDLKVSDEDLQMKSAQELKLELQKGTETTVEDFNPLKLLRKRK
jgi:hypothetical protein